MRTATQSPTMDEVLAIIAPTPCRCGDGSCMMCDDNGMRHVEVIAAGHKGYGYVTDGEVDAWGEVEVAFADRDPVRVHWSALEVLS